MNEDHLSLFGMPIFLDDSMDIEHPVRKHKRRRNQSLAYHRRIQKKWRKRYGWVISERVMEFTSKLTGVRMLAMSHASWARFKADKALMERQRIPEPDLLLDPKLPRRQQQ